MFRPFAILSLSLSSMLVGPSPALAQSGIPVYRTHMYSDASHTTEVGYIWGQCGWNGVQYYLVGTYTYYQEDELVGYCGGGGGPIE